MKKIVTLVLAIALLMTSVVAIAETKATPNINTFAKMTTKFIEGSATQAKRYEIKLSKPVTKLWVLWAEKGAEPEELAVDENLSATALAVEHKYMPGIKQSIGKSNKEITTKDYKWVVTSEDEYGYPVEWELQNTLGDVAWPTSPVAYVYEVEKNEKVQLNVWTTNDDGTPKTYIVSYMTEDGPDFDIVKSVEEAKAWYEAFHDGYKATKVTEPKAIKTGKQVVVDKFGNKADEIVGYVPGSIQGTKTTVSFNKKFETNKATLGDRAFATLEGVTEDFAGWVVYRNRFGNFVAIEAYEGQL